MKVVRIAKGVVMVNGKRYHYNRQTQALITRFIGKMVQMEDGPLPVRTHPSWMTDYESYEKIEEDMRKEYL